MVNIVDHPAGSKFVFSRYVSRIAMIPCSGAKHPALGIVRGQCRSSSCCSVLRQPIRGGSDQKSNPPWRVHVETRLALSVFFGRPSWA